MNIKNLSCLLLLLCSQPLVAKDSHHVYAEVKGYFKNQLTKAYCMAKRNCHQRVIYVMNASTKEKVTLNGCGFKRSALSPYDHQFTHQKNSSGNTCTLSVHRKGKLDSKVTLTPYSHGVHFNKQGRLGCTTITKVLKSFKKCPVFCGHYKVMGYISICSAYD